MAKKAKPTTINRAGSGSHPDLSRYCRDLGMAPFLDGVGKRPAGGRKAGRLLRPVPGASGGVESVRKTIRKHIDNLWILGGEIIRDLNETPSLRKVPVERLLFDVLDEEGGPLIPNCNSEEQQHSFDATCRKLRRYLIQQQS